MRVVFMGTPDFAARILQRLARHHEVAAAYTRPDAVRGRGSRPVPSEVKALCLRLGIPVVERRSLRDAADQQALAALAPDVVCVAAYGALLPPEVLAVPRLGCLNVHASLLPRWRGAAPIERAILAGDELAGVSIMRMEEGMDTGAFCAQRSTPIGHKHAAALTAELAGLGADALIEILARLEAGEPLAWTEQDAALVTLAPKVAKEELELSCADAPAALVRKVAASGPARPARAVVAGRPVTVLGLALPDEDVSRQAAELRPGQVVLASKRLLLGCEGGAVQLSRVKPDGKKEQDATAFAAGIQNLKRAGAAWGGGSR